MAYGDKILFYKKISFILKILTSQSKCLEKRRFFEFSPLQELNIFILPFLDTLGYTLFKKCLTWEFFFVFWPFGGTVKQKKHINAKKSQTPIDFDLTLFVSRCMLLF